MKTLSGSNIVIVGGQRIGGEIAKALLAQGAGIAMTYLKSEDEVSVVEAAMGSDLKRGFFAQCDVTDEESVARFVSGAREKFHEMQGLIYMASIFPKAGNPMPGESDWHAMLEVHLLGAERFMRQLAPMFQSNEDGGKVIIFSDGAAETRRPYAGFRHYLVSKGAASEYVRAAAVDFAPKILVNGIAPGPILPPSDYTETEIKEVADLSLLKRWGGTDEIVKAALYLLDQNFLTGQVLVVDGGRYLFSQ